MNFNRSLGIRLRIRAAAVSGVLSAMFLISCAAAHTPEDGKLDANVVAARAMLDSWDGKSEDLEGAREKIAKALEANPENVFALKEMARYQIKAGFLYDRQISRENHVRVIPVFRPDTLQRAEATIRSAIGIDGNFAEGYILLSNIQFLEEDLEEATRSLKKAESIGTKDPWLQLNWANIDQAKGNDASAEARWRQVLQSDTKNDSARAAATGFLLDSYIKSGDAAKAVALYEEMIKRDPHDAWLRGNFADYLGEMGRDDEAVAQARASLKLMDYGVGHRILAMALFRKWAEMLTQDPKDSAAEKLFLEAQENYPDLNAAMAYGASMPRGEHVAKALINKSVSIDSQANDGSTALLIATNTNRADVVKTLLDLNADPNIADSSGWTPLLSAADEGNTEIVNLLLKRGADTHATLRGRNASEMAAKKGHTELAEMLKAVGTGKQ